MARKQQPREGQTVRRDGRDYTYRNGRFVDDRGFSVTDTILFSALMSDCGCDAGSSSSHGGGYDSGGYDSGGDSGGGGDGGGGD